MERLSKCKGEDYLTKNKKYGFKLKKRRKINYERIKNF